MAIEMMSISHCYCSDYMTKPTQFGDEPKKWRVALVSYTPFVFLQAKAGVINTGGSRSWSSGYIFPG